MPDQTKVKLKLHLFFFYIHIAQPEHHIAFREKCFYAIIFYYLPHRH